MASWTNETQSSSSSWSNKPANTSSWSNVSANTSTWNNVEQAGEGWDYNDSQYTYNEIPLFYNGFGLSQSWSNISQSSAPSWSNVTAN